MGHYPKNGDDDVQTVDHTEKRRERKEGIRDDVDDVHEYDGCIHGYRFD